MYSIVSGGFCNRACGHYTSITGGRQNNTCGCACAMIVGSNICADRVCATFVNNLSIINIPTEVTGLPAGSVWSNAGILTIV